MSIYCQACNDQQHGVKGSTLTEHTCKGVPQFKPLDEKRLRTVVPLVLAAYAPSYHFNNAGGLFIERVINNVFRKHEDYLKSAIYLTLVGCSCKDDGLSIPCKIREEIETKILRAYAVGEALTALQLD